MFLIINSGSSSLKFKVFSPQLKELAGGIVERIGLKDSFLAFEAGKTKEKYDHPSGISNHTESLGFVFEALAKAGIKTSDIKAVGHRVVHGGEEFTAPTVIDDKVYARLETYNQLAPLHNPPNLMGIASCRKLLPYAKNVAVFDTAFYKTIPDYAYMYALPYEYYEKHRIRKYGFHGISHRYVTEEAARILKKPYAKLKFVSCHLGSGSSVTAVRNGKAVDTSMGFTPLEGLTMSTRCGDIDPAIPLYLIMTFGLSVNEVDDLLNKKSGLLGVSGYKDLRDVLSAAGEKLPGYKLAEKPTPEVKKRARLAFDMFCYDVARYVGEYSAIVGGADAIIFTAGIGERSSQVRDKVISMVKLAGKPKVLVVPTNEELMIAREVKKAVR